MNIDLAFSYALAAVILSGILAYLFRIFTRGSAKYSRVERQGGSKLLNEDLMTMGYWWFEPIGHWFNNRGVTPNQVTWLSLVCAIIATLCLALGMFGIAAWFMLFAGLLDIVDGLVARLSGIQDPAGAVLDSSLDRYVDFLFLAGLLVYYIDSIFFVVIVMTAMLGTFMISYSSAKAEAMQIEPPRGMMKRSERLVYIVAATGLTPFSIAYIESNWTFTPALGLPIFLVVCMFAVLTNVSAVQRLKALGLAARKQAMGEPQE